MNLKEEFLAALREGRHFDDLLKLVHRYKEQGISTRDAYDVLHQIWLDHGFDDSDEDSKLRDDLECVMEKTWFGCPARESLDS